MKECPAPSAEISKEEETTRHALAKDVDTNRLIKDFGGEVIKKKEVGDVYINIPENLNPDKKPRVVIYFHGWKGELGGTGYGRGNDMNAAMKQIQNIREETDNPLIFIAPQSKSTNWEKSYSQNFFPNILELIEDDTPISIVAFSGGSFPFVQIIDKNYESLNNVDSVIFLDAAYGKKETALGKIKNFSETNRVKFYIASAETEAGSKYLEENLSEQVSHETVKTREDCKWQNHYRIRDEYLEKFLKKIIQ